MNRQPIFSAVKQLRNGQGFTMAEVRLLDAAIDAALAVVTPPLTPAGPTVPVPTSTHRRISAKGEALIHSFESCKLAAYPDPGSRDGKPWTIGWGSTGEDIAKGLTWTQAQCDERFRRDIGKYERGVEEMLAGSPATQNQFDALVSLAYNIGVRALRGSTVMRKHKAGDYKNAARAFLMWNRNDGSVMRGLTRRRLAESELYDD